MLKRAGDALLAVVDGLFGDPEPGPPRRWLPRYLGVAALLVAVIVARRPDAVTHPQFWAEDSYVFFYENLTLGFPQAVATFYHGFPYLSHRLIAFLGGLVPLAQAPRVYTTAAIAVTALALASFSLPGFRHLVRSDGLRVLFGVAALSAPFDQEVLATPTNLSWFIAVWLSLLSLMRLPQRRWRLGALAVLGSVAVCSTPLAVVNLPLWLLRAWRGARRDRWLWLVLIGALVGTLVLTSRLGADDRFSFWDGPLSYIGFWLRFVVERAVAILAPGWLDQLRVPDEVRRLVVLASIATALLVGASAATGFRTLPALGAAMALFGAALAVCAIGRPILLWIAPWMVSMRYAIFPSAMAALVLVIALDGLPHGVPRWAVGVALALGLAWSWGPRFPIPPLADLSWPRYAALLERKLATRSPAPLTIPMNPPFVRFEFDPLQWSHEVEVRADGILAGLGSRGSFRQYFVSRCDGLSGIRLIIAEAARSDRGLLEVSIVDGRNGSLVRVSSRPRAELEFGRAWDTFWFPPITGSAGREYAFILRAIDNDGDATIYVTGARGDPYPDGKAVFLGQVVDGDAAFNYGCTPVEDGARP